MKRKSVSINLEGEQMARNIAMLVQRASKYESSIYIQSGDKRVNAKSIMGMMTLGMDLSEDLEISAEGADEETALEGITGFLTGEE
ncbi:MAG: HPr family phosphocarrier protein [Lachnospiraceae bacterium]|jgi:phosphotransferase system HPr (HPr) family protein|nr:HPr family phosphocarrier protein [uncultured Acetatifactor sp.]MCI9218790.1 HPr family phosphocarrier protein [Lachnospiraceae bacterium]